jgi:hypothetical protein
MATLTVVFMTTTILLALALALTVFMMRELADRKAARSFQWGMEAGRKQTEAMVPKKMIKVTVPSFGEPELKIYAPADFSLPLVCTSCEEALTKDQDYYEIPVLNGLEGAVTAVHLKCERKLSYG